MTTFRIHYGDGTTVYVDAETPNDAREVAKGRRAGKISKVKVVKEKANG